MTPPAPATCGIPCLNSIASIAIGSQAWLVDIWGVIHNGVRPFPSAVAACERFVQTGGTVILLSNSPRPSEGVIAQLDRIGVSRSAYHAVVSSGDVSRAVLRAAPDAMVFHLGPDRDLPLFEGLGTRLVGKDDATLMLCSGLVDDETETPDDYREMLSSLAARDLRMICANPDLMVVRGNRTIYCAGALAQVYEELGGAVHYTGKPHAAIYERAFSTLTELRGARVAAPDMLAIGDGITTDILGATRMSVPAVFVGSGLHGGDGLTPEVLRALFPDPRVQPIAALPKLAW